MKQPIFLFAVAMLILVYAFPASAANLDNAKFALHATTSSGPLGAKCTTNDPISQGIPCSQYTTNWPVGTAADVYLMVAQIDSASGFKGIRCGIDYDALTASGADVFGWTGCEDGLEFPNTGPNGDWPAAGSGTTITWVTCQQTVIPPDDAHAVVGSFYVYAYSQDRFFITPNNNLPTPELALADCVGTTTYFPLDAVTGAVDFGSGSGVNPCLAPPPPPAAFDFEPGECPNTLLEGNGGFVDAAVVGTAGFAVSSVNQSTIRVEGVTPQRITVKDVATPFSGTPCGCLAAGGDGMDDLALRISRPDLLAAIGPVQVGDEVVLTVTGQLMDGTPFSASDCAVIDAHGMPTASAELALAPEGGSGRVRKLSYTLPRDGMVRLAVFNVQGAKVADLVNGSQTQGVHEAAWDVAGSPNGVYFYRLETAGAVKTAKVMLLR